MNALGYIREDVRTVFAKDPAARTTWEVLILYPGLHAIWLLLDYGFAKIEWRCKF